MTGESTLQELRGMTLRHHSMEEGACMAFTQTDQIQLLTMLQELETLENEILSLIGDLRVSQVSDSDLRQDLLRIRNRETLIAKLQRKARELGIVDDVAQLRTEEERAEAWRWVTSAEFDSILQNEILARVDPTSLLERKRELGTLLTGRELPPTIMRQFERVRECYLFGFDEAAVIYARTLVEVTLREVLKKLGKEKVPVPQPRDKQQKIDNVSLDPLIRAVQELGILTSELSDDIKSVQRVGNKAAHGNPLADKDGADIIRQAMGVVEALYKEVIQR